MSNNFSVNGGVLFAEDGYQNLTGTVTIGSSGLTAYTQWNTKDLAFSQLAGSGPLVIDSTIAAGSTAGGAGGIVHVSGAGYTGTITVNPAGVAALAGTRATGLGGELEVNSAAALTDAAVVMNGARGIAFGSGGCQSRLRLFERGRQFRPDHDCRGLGRHLDRRRTEREYNVHRRHQAAAAPLDKVGSGVLALTQDNAYLGGTTVTLERSC